MTYAEALSIAISCPALSAEVTEKLAALSERMAKKPVGERKPSARQVANAKANSEMEQKILDYMEYETEYTVSNLLKSIPEFSILSNQKVSALVRNLVAANALRREVRKGRAYFIKNLC